MPEIYNRRYLCSHNQMITCNIGLTILLFVISLTVSACFQVRVPTPIPNPPKSLALSVIPNVTKLRPRQSVVVEVTSTGWEDEDLQWSLLSDLEDPGSLSEYIGKTIVYQAPRIGGGDVTIAVTGKTENYTGTNQIELTVQQVDSNVFETLMQSQSKIVMINGNFQKESSSSIQLIATETHDFVGPILVSNKLQQSENCLLNEDLQTVLKVAFDVCREINRNWACLASGSIEPSSQQRFIRPGDRIPIDILGDFQTLPPDGIVVMNMSIPNESYPLWVIAYTLGYEPLYMDMNFLVSINNGNVLCEMTPPGMVIRTESVQIGRITINGVQIKLE